MVYPVEYNYEANEMKYPILLTTALFFSQAPPRRSSRSPRPG